jgi:hypothetical protein
MLKLSPGLLLFFGNKMSLSVVLISVFHRILDLKRAGFLSGLFSFVQVPLLISRRLMVQGSGDRPCLYRWFFIGYWITNPADVYPARFVAKKIPQKAGSYF